VARNIFSVFAAIAFCAVAQQQIQTTEPSQYAWREYTYPKEKFAITFPYAPETHPHRQYPEQTVYTVRFIQDVVLNIYGGLAPNCKANLKDVVQQNSRVFAMPEPTEIHMGLGITAFELKGKQGNRWRYARFWCGDQRAFSAVAGGPEGTGKPPEIQRILDSFRIIQGSK